MARKQSRRTSKAAKIQKKKPRSPGWLSTDEEEIERRQQRGADELISIEALEPEQAFFGSFSAHSQEGSHYQVEIRSLKERLNSCDCPDYQVNGLSTCKHIEAILLKLPKGRVRKFRQAVAEGSPRIEIYLDRPREQVRILWPEALTTRSAAYRLLDPFFSSDGSLLADPLNALPSLQRQIAAAAAPVQAQIRLSRHLQPWLRELRYRHEREHARASFEQDVAQGKRSLDLVNVPLYPYQQEGMLHLAFTERALLADDMGLGKTVEAIAACELLRRQRGIQRVLVVAPASLKTEWEEQIAKFTGQPSLIIQGSRAARLKLYRQEAFFYLTNYEQIRADLEVIQQTLAPDVIILDEAQRIKNWQTKTANAVKKLDSRYAFVLTGTPLENRIDEVYSIVQFLDPGLFGPLFRFNRDFYQLDEHGRPTGYKNLDELHRRLQPVMLRRRKEDVEGQLPGRTIKNYYVGMHPEQSERYDEYNAHVARLTAAARKRPLTQKEFERLQKWLACMRMVCDTPYILDPECRVAPKLSEFENVLPDMLEDYERKIIVFSEWTRMLELVGDLVREMDLDFAWHTGSVPQPKRRDEINRFKQDPDCRLFLSTDSGSTGLNLQNASVVVNMDLPWNPARLEQRISRAWRKHQTRSVQVINLVCENSIEHRMLHMLDRKQALADSVIDGSGELINMDIPSGRQAFVERVEGLMGRPAPHRVVELPLALEDIPEPPLDPLQQLKQDTVARLSDRLDQLQVYDRVDGRERTVLAVVDRVDDTTQEVISQAVGAQAPEAHLELLDRATFDTIQRLIKAGVLQLSEQGAQVLHQSPNQEQRRSEQHQRWLQEARERFAAAERERRMAGVLAAGGFPLEALKPLRQAMETALQALAHAFGQQQDEPAVPLKFIESRLVKEDMLPGEAPSIIAQLREAEADEAGAMELFRRSDGMLDYAAEALDRSALR